jgi:hypothetical protein
VWCEGGLDALYLNFLIKVFGIGEFVCKKARKEEIESLMGALLG